MSTWVVAMFGYEWVHLAWCVKRRCYKKMISALWIRIILSWTNEHPFYWDAKQTTVATPHCQILQNLVIGCACSTCVLSMPITNIRRNTPILLWKWIPSCYWIATGVLLFIFGWIYKHLCIVNLFVLGLIAYDEMWCVLILCIAKFELLILDWLQLHSCFTALAAIMWSIVNELHQIQNCQYLVGFATIFALWIGECFSDAGIAKWQCLIAKLELLFLYWF